MMMKKELKSSEQKYYLILYNKFSIKNIVYKYIWRMEWRKFFFCKKKLITGPLSLKSMILTLTIQIIPLILFMVFNIEVII